MRLLLCFAEPRWFNCGVSWGRWNSSLLECIWATCH